MIAILPILLAVAAASSPAAPYSHSLPSESIIFISKPGTARVTLPGKVGNTVSYASRSHNYPAIGHPSSVQKYVSLIITSGKN